MKVEKMNDVCIDEMTSSKRKTNVYIFPARNIILLLVTSNCTQFSVNDIISLQKKYKPYLITLSAGKYAFKF